MLRMTSISSQEVRQRQQRQMAAKLVHTPMEEDLVLLAEVEAEGQPNHLGHFAQRCCQGRSLVRDLGYHGIRSIFQRYCYKHFAMDQTLPRHWDPQPMYITKGTHG